MSFRRDPSAGKPRPWFERDPSALARIKAVVAAHPSALDVRVDSDRELVFIEGKLRYAPRQEGGTPDFVHVTVTIQDANAEPVAEETYGRFPKTARFHKRRRSNELCLWLPPKSQWTPDDDGLRRYLDQVVLHVDRQLHLEANPNAGWPGDEYPHTATAAYGDLLVEELGSFELAERFIDRWRKGHRSRRNDPCPCGSGRKWKGCHRDTIERFERRCDATVLSAIFQERLFQPPKDAA